MERKMQQLMKEIQENTDGSKALLTETVGPDQIADVVSRWTGIPVTKLSQNEKDRLLHLGEDVSGMNAFFFALNLFTFLV
jgi:ATP-dependent Clp protease ATP-binding subunit ClpB